MLKKYNDLVRIIVLYGVIWSLNYELGAGPRRTPYKRKSILGIY